MRRLLGALDARDAFFAVGLTLVVIGLAKIYTPAAYLVPGLALIAVAVWRVR